MSTNIENLSPTWEELLNNKAERLIDKTLCRKGNDVPVLALNSGRIAAVEESDDKTMVVFHLHGAGGEPLTVCASKFQLPEYRDHGIILQMGSMNKEYLFICL